MAERSEQPELPQLRRRAGQDRRQQRGQHLHRAHSLRWRYRADIEHPALRFLRQQLPLQCGLFRRRAHRQHHRPERCNDQQEFQPDTDAGQRRFHVVDHARQSECRSARWLQLRRQPAGRAGHCQSGQRQHQWMRHAEPDCERRYIDDQFLQWHGRRQRQLHHSRQRHRGGDWQLRQHHQQSVRRSHRHGQFGDRDPGREQQSAAGNRGLRADACNVALPYRIQRGSPGADHSQCHRFRGAWRGCFGEYANHAYRRWYGRMGIEWQHRWHAAGHGQQRLLRFPAQHHRTQRGLPGFQRNAAQRERAAGRCRLLGAGRRQPRNRHAVIQQCDRYTDPERDRRLWRRKLDWSHLGAQSIGKHAFPHLLLQCRQHQPGFRSGPR